MRAIWAALLGGGLLIAALSGVGVSTVPIATAVPGDSESVSAESDSPDADDADGDRDRAGVDSGRDESRADGSDGESEEPAEQDIDGQLDGENSDGQSVGESSGEEPRGVGFDSDPEVAAQDEEPTAVVEDAGVDSSQVAEEPPTAGPNAGHGAEQPEKGGAERPEIAESDHGTQAPETDSSIAEQSAGSPLATEPETDSADGEVVAAPGSAVEVAPGAHDTNAAAAVTGAATDNVEGASASRGSAGEAIEKASVTMSAAEPSPPRSTLLSLVGSVVMNLVVGLVQLLDGPPALPPNSTVTVRTSSLTLPIGSGRSVQADWYFPEHIDETTRFVYLQHGFLASGPMYSYTAADLAERTNSIVVAPSLSSNFFAPDAAWVGGSTMQRAVAELFVGERTALTESVRAAAGWDIELPDDFVLVGHSAGGTVVVSAAGHLVGTDAFEHLRGVVMLDGVEPSASPAVRQALGKLTGASDKPIYLISSERYFWSRGGDMADKLQLARPDRFNGVGLAGGLHIDYMESGNRFIQFMQYLIGGFSQPENVRAAGLITAGWVNDLFAGTTENGIYGQPGEQITIDTDAGAATALVLPLGYPSRPVWPPLLEAVLTAIFDSGGKYLFVYDPLPGFEPSAPSTSAELRLDPELTAI